MTKHDSSRDADTGKYAARNDAAPSAKPAPPELQERWEGASFRLWDKKGDKAA